MNQNPKVNEEVVTVVCNEVGDPEVIVRKSTNNGGKVQLFKLLPMGFSDITLFLKQLADEVSLKEKHAPTDNHH